MLTIHCPTHGRDVLLTPGRIDGLVNTSKGIVLRWRCWCGTTGRLLTGAHARRDAPASEEAPEPEGEAEQTSAAGGSAA